MGRKFESYCRSQEKPCTIRAGLFALKRGTQENPLGGLPAGLDEPAVKLVRRWAIASVEGTR